MAYQIVYHSGHVEVKDENGIFLFSEDTEEAALKEIGEMEAKPKSA